MPNKTPKDKSGTPVYHTPMIADSYKYVGPGLALINGKLTETRSAGHMSVVRLCEQRRNPPVSAPLFKK